MSTNSDSESIFSKMPSHNYQVPFENVDAAGIKAFESVLRTRRSVRVYDGTAIPEVIVERCLDLALLAPNSSNLQSWEFYWVRSAQKKSELVKACLSQPAAATAAELFVCVARPDHWVRNTNKMLEYFSEVQKGGTHISKGAWDYYKKIVPQMYNQGLFGFRGLCKKIVLFFYGLSRPVPREPNSHSEMHLWAAKSCALACENLMLAFRAHGYDTCPMEGLDSKRVKKILDLPHGASVVMAISAGKRAQNGVYGPQVRFERSMFVKQV